MFGDFSEHFSEYEDKEVLCQCRLCGKKETFTSEEGRKKFMCSCQFGKKRFPKMQTLPPLKAGEIRIAKVMHRGTYIPITEEVIE